MLNPLRSVAVATALALSCGVASLASCHILEHALTVKIPPGLNLDLGKDVIWRRIPPLELSGTWIDAAGGRVTIQEQGGLGEVTVQTEDTRFFWTDGTLLALNGRVELTRRLAGQKVDELVGGLICNAVDGQCALSIDFGAGGIWSREGGAVPVAGNWYIERKEVRLQHTGGDTFTLAADPALGWTTGTGTIRGQRAEFRVQQGTGPMRPLRADLRVGHAWTMEDIAAAHEEAQRAAAAGR